MKYSRSTTYRTKTQYASPQKQSLGLRHSRRHTKKVKRDIGAPGKGLAKSIGPLRKGELTKFGYENVVKLSAQDRHAALKKAVAEYGSLSVWRKLNAVAVYTRRISPASSRVFQSDMDWIRATFGIKAF